MRMVHIVTQQYQHPFNLSGSLNRLAYDGDEEETLRYILFECKASNEAKKHLIQAVWEAGDRKSILDHCGDWLQHLTEDIGPLVSQMLEADLQGVIPMKIITKLTI